MLKILGFGVQFCVLIALGNTIAEAKPMRDTEHQVCVVSGQVTNVLSGIPIGKARLELEAAGNDAENFEFATTFSLGFGLARKGGYSAFSQADGSFCFEAVEPGRYRLTGTKAGFLNTSYGATSPTQSGKTVVVDPQFKTTFDLALIPQSVISGRVIDEDGEPVDGAGVKILKRTWVSGRFRNVTARSTQTNDLGEFRLAGVSPGTYYVLAQPKLEQPRSAGTQNIAAAVASHELLTSFYPGVTAIVDATPILIQAGEERSSISIQLQTGHTHHIRGRISGPLGSNDQGFIILSPQYEEPAFIMAGGRNYKSDGTFDFSGLTPGAYNLTYFEISGEASKGGRQAVQVRDQDVNNVVLAIAMPASIRGRIKFDGVSYKTLGISGNPSLHVALTTSDALIGPTSIAKFSNDNSFVIDDITPGKYTVQAEAPPGAYVKSVRYQQNDITGKELDLSYGGSGELEIIYHFGLAKVTGTLEYPQKGSANDNLPPSHIILVPDVLDSNGSGIQFGSSDSGDTFSIKDVRPGHYHAYAFDSIDFVALHEPSVLKALEPLGTEFTLGEGEEKSITLHLISVKDQQHILSQTGGQ